MVSSLSSVLNGEKDKEIEVTRGKEGAEWMRVIV